MSSTHPSPLGARLRASCERLLPSTLASLRDMVEVNSFTLNPEGVTRVAELTADTFAPLGFAADSVAAENPAHAPHLVLSRPGRGSRTVALISHLDTVYTAQEEREHGFRWREESDRIYGPGILDIKGGTMLAHLTLAALRECAPEQFERTHWVFLLNSAEEVPSADFGRLCCQRIPRDACAALVFEGGARAGTSHAMVTARKGRALFRVSAMGRSAHAGSHHARGINAIAQLAHTVQRIEALTDPARELTFNAGVVSGGTVVNRVPEAAAAEVEMRAFDPAVYAAGVAALRALEQDIVVYSREDGQPCRVSVELSSETPPWPANPGTEALLRVWQEAGRGLGLTVVRQERGGVSDGNLIWRHVPTLDGLGPCGDHAHCAVSDPATGRVQEFLETPTLVTKGCLNALALHTLLS
jgi:glutamate carboxypeptidase